MSHRIARVLGASFLAGLLVTGAGPAVGGKGGIQDLPVTGHTVGGPGRLDLRDEERRVWASSVASDLCVTVSNGNREAELEFTQTGNVETSIPVLAGEAFTICRDAVEEVAFSCFAPPSRNCSLAYRIDR